MYTQAEKIQVQSSLVSGIITRLLGDMSLLTNFELVKDPPPIGRSEKLDSMIALYKNLSASKDPSSTFYRLPVGTKFGLCNYFYSIGKLDMAVELLEDVIRCLPGRPKPILCRALIMEELGILEEAIKSYESAIQNGIGTNTAMYRKGCLLAKMSRNEEAKRCFEAVLKKDSMHLPAWYDTGLLVSESLPEDALRCFEKAICINPSHVPSLYNKGVVCERLERFDDSLSCFDGVLRMRPQHLPSLFHKAIVLSKIGLGDSAISTFEAVLAINPRHLPALYYKGVLLSDMTRRREAIECFDRTLDIDPDHLQALYNKGFALESLGLYDDALDCYDRIIQVDQDYGNILCQKGRLLSSIGRHAEAIGYFDRALVQNPSNTNAIFYKSCTVLKEESSEESLKALQTVITLDSRYRDILRDEIRVEGLKVDKGFKNLVN